jgi:hypothetical protein
MTGSTLVAAAAVRVEFGIEAPKTARAETSSIDCFCLSHWWAREAPNEHRKSRSRCNSSQGDHRPH